MNSDNVFSNISSAILSLFNSNGAFFQSVGRNEFYGLVALALFWFGVQTMFAGFDESRFVRLITMILLTAAVLSNYPRFFHIVSDQASYLSSRLEVGQMNLLQERLNQAAVGTEQPSVANIAGMFWYFSMMLVIMVERFVSLGVVAFGFMAQAVAALLGPLFIPWVICPGASWIAQGWVRAYVQYSFYTVVAAAMGFINALWMANFFIANPYPWSVDQLPYLVIKMATAAGISAFALLQIPSLTSSLFSGRSGEGFFRS